jgi:hypothetical protein
VEDWFKYIEESMRNSLKVILRNALIKFENETVIRTEWLKEYPF